MVLPTRHGKDVAVRAREGQSGFVTAGDLVDGDAPGRELVDPRARLDERAEQLHEVAARYQELVERSQEAFACAARLSGALRSLEELELREGLSWATADERARIRTLRAAVDVLLGKGVEVSPVPAFVRHLPSKYYAFEFLRENSVSTEQATDAIGMSESAYRKAWHDYNNTAPTALDPCTWCGAVLDVRGRCTLCADPHVTNTATS